MRHYVTACRAQQLGALYESMARWCQPFTLHILCWDFPIPRWAMSTAARIEFTSRGTFLQRHPEYGALPGTPRTTNESVCAARWRFAIDAMDQADAPVTVIDGDQWFWSSPEDVFREIGSAGVALSPHRIAPASAGLPGVTEESHGRYGRFNGGWSYWSSFAALERMSDLAFECSRATTHRWPDGCVTWGDQGALELIHEEYGAWLIEHRGVNVGPWNVHTQPLRRSHDGRVFFGGRPLVSYHYSSLRPGVQLADAPYEVSETQTAMLYEPYLAALAR